MTHPANFAGAARYVLDDELSRIVNISIALEMPLLLKGEKIWFRDLTEISRPGIGTQRKPAAMEMPRPSPSTGPKTNRKAQRFATSWESPKTAKTNREAKSEFRSNTLISSKSRA